MDDSQTLQTTPQHRWPEGAIVYHIYPRSLQDSNGDGIGDLPGIISRLDYIKDLGANAIWLSPFYPSPMADFGYDVADYCDVDPIFGSLSDFDRLVQMAHASDLRVIIDLVPNHSSDAHEWFQQSRLDRTNPYADWYVWQDPRYDPADSSHENPLPPNNWLDAHAGGSAWQWDNVRGQFYLHSFHAKQPDLNWGNPKVRAAMRDVMRFWLDRGVDGFRVDAVYWMGKEPLFADDSRNPDYVEGESLRYDALLHDNSRGWPSMYAYLSSMANVLKEPKYQDSERFMVTEAYPEHHNPLSAYLNFYAAVDPKVAAPFNFEGITLPWKAMPWRRFLRGFNRALGGLSSQCIPSYAFGNHDRSRLASRLGIDTARSAAVMLFTLPGMIFVYYGEEIGMTNGEIPPEKVLDPAAKGDPKSGIGRDPQRTPMQWDGGKNAGFTSADEPWLPVASGYTERNVAVESDEPASFLSLYRRLGKLRGSIPALKYGTLSVIDTGQADVLGYVRRSRDGSDAYLTLVNFSDQTLECRLPYVAGEVLAASDLNIAETQAQSGIFTLSPHSAVLASIKG